MDYGLDNRVRFSAEARDFSLLLSIHTGSESHPMGTGGSFHEDKAARACI
jgi:hypothetical protein